MNGSSRGTLNIADVLNSLKHMAFTVVAAALVPIVQSGSIDLQQIKSAALIAAASGLITLLGRLAQDNR